MLDAAAQISPHDDAAIKALIGALGLLISVIGFLISYQVRNVDKKLGDHGEKLEVQGRDIVEVKTTVREHERRIDRIEEREDTNPNRRLLPHGGNGGGD